MKKSIIFIIFISLFIHLDAQMLITTAQMNNINSSQSAFEGQIYKNTQTNIFYIGLSGGTLKTIGELNTISSNASLTGDGTSGSPLGIAPMGASTGQVLVWNGSAWTPSDITTPSSNKKLVLSAEYAGAVIVPGSGTNHTGDMIGGNTGNNSPRYMNYYEWKGRSSSGIQTYQIILRITLPNDFTEWLNNAIVIDYLVNSGCNLQLSFYNLSNTLLTSQTLYSSGWNTTTILASSLSSWITPGETVALIITLSSTNNNVVRIGDIILNYK